MSKIAGTATEARSGFGATARSSRSGNSTGIAGYKVILVGHRKNQFTGPGTRPFAR